MINNKKKTPKTNTSSTAKREHHLFFSLPNRSIPFITITFPFPTPLFFFLPLLFSILFLVVPPTSSRKIMLPRRQPQGGSPWRKEREWKGKKGTIRGIPNKKVLGLGCLLVFLWFFWFFGFFLSGDWRESEGKVGFGAEECANLRYFSSLIEQGYGDPFVAPFVSWYVVVCCCLLLFVIIVCCCLLLIFWVLFWSISFCLPLT